MDQSNIQINKSQHPNVELLKFIADKSVYVYIHSLTYSITDIVDIVSISHRNTKSDVEASLSST